MARAVAHVIHARSPQPRPSPRSIAPRFRTSCSRASLRHVKVRLLARIATAWALYCRRRHDIPRRGRRNPADLQSSRCACCKRASTSASRRSHALRRCARDRRDQRDPSARSPTAGSARPHTGQRVSDRRQASAATTSRAASHSSSAPANSSDPSEAAGRTPAPRLAGNIRESRT